MTDRFETFTVLIAKLGRSIRRIKNQEMAEYELRAPHVSCLYYLNSGELTVTDLSERCEEDKATISRSLDYLEERGYIMRERGAAKRYKSPIRLTDDGRQVAAVIAERVNRVLDAVSDELSEEERCSLYRSLQLLSDRLEELSRD